MEQIATLIVMNIFVVPAIIIGIVLCCGKGSVDWIAGINTASPEERASWDEQAICRAAGVLMLVIVGCVELLLLGDILGMTALMWCGGILLAVTTVFGLIYINTSKRLRRK